LLLLDYFVMDGGLRVARFGPFLGGGLRPGCGESRGAPGKRPKPGLLSVRHCSTHRTWRRL
jgi:hypothetical protein